MHDLQLLLARVEADSPLLASIARHIEQQLNGNSDAWDALWRLTGEFPGSLDELCNAALTITTS